VRDLSPTPTRPWSPWWRQNLIWSDGLVIGPAYGIDVVRIAVFLARLAVKVGAIMIVASAAEDENPHALLKSPTLRSASRPRRAFAGHQLTCGWSRSLVRNLVNTRCSAPIPCSGRKGRPSRGIASQGNGQIAEDACTEQVADLLYDCFVDMHRLARPMSNGLPGPRTCRKPWSSPNQVDRLKQKAQPR
jgi:hypothetical protein